MGKEVVKYMYVCSEVDVYLKFFVSFWFSVLV
jgi:hypothetical protein